MLNCYRGGILYLNNTKQLIYEYAHLWDVFKRYTNPYEFIYCIPKKNDNEFKTASLTTIDPLSRSFFKMIEICNTFHLLDPYKNIDINTFHLAEGPGGFIEAMVYMRQKPNDT